MNSCGQHGLAEIGFHGSSLKANGKVIPSVQVMLGGGTVGDGLGRIAERVIKVPSKRAVQVLQILLDDFKKEVNSSESFHQYYDRQGKDYFYRLLKPLADLGNLLDTEYVDWGHEETFETAIGVGECAGVIIDLVATLIFEAEEKLEWAHASLMNGAYADAIYHTYSVLISTAKALLLDKGINCSTQHGVIREFDTHFENHGLVGSFSDLVMQINKNEPSKAFALSYFDVAQSFVNQIKNERESLNKNGA